MDKKGLIITCIWAVVMMAGIIIGRFTGEITSGEFYLCLMMWLYVAVWFADRNGDDGWKK